MYQRKSRTCCVPGCLNGHFNSVLHGFPNPDKYPARFREWLYAIGGDILALSNEYIYKYCRVCRGHFEEKDCCRFNRLSNSAIPTINMHRSLFLTPRPLQPIQNIMFPIASTSKGPAITECDVNLRSSHINKNISLSLHEEKENINKIKGPAVTECDVNIRSSHINKNISLSLHEEKENINKIKVVSKKSICLPKNKHHIERQIKYIPMSIKEKELHKKLLNLRVKLSKYKNKITKQNVELTSARKLFSNPEFINIMENSNTSAKIFTMLQFREAKKKSKGRRFTTPEKIIALTMLKHSPKAYRFLRKIFILPSPQTLIRLLHRSSLKPGINKNIFSQLRERAQNMKLEHKLCALLFDEMQLKASISYNERNDKVTGFVTDGLKTSNILADHAQVFMIRGLIKNYKQPIAYTFSAGATKGIDLARQIKEVIREVQKAGFIVVATICDQGTNNRQAIKIIKEETRRQLFHQGVTEPNENIIIINGYEVVPIYDTPHLLKGVRNNLITKNLKYNLDNIPRVAKWSHLQRLYDENPGFKNIRLIPNLTENHVIPGKIGKMKVKYASQIFSKTVAANMAYLAEKSILPAECRDTAELCLFMDTVFDSVNGSYTAKHKYSKPLLGAVTPQSCHKKTWKQAIKTFKTMQFISNGNKKELVPTIQGWILTLEGMQEILRQLVLKYKITSFWMRHLNQDCLENFFGAIRSHGCRNTNPTAEQFESAFTTLLINNLVSVHSPGTNCELDMAETLYSFIVQDCETYDECDIDINDLNIGLTPIENKTDARIIAPLYYISGYFIMVSKKLWKGCKTCKNCLISQQEREYIRYREYAGRNWLHNPNDNVVEVISQIQDITDFYLKKYINRPFIKELLKTAIHVMINFDFLNCSVHGNDLKNYLINKTTRFFIYTYCKNINKIIYGKRNIEDENDYLQQHCKNYFNKHFKKKNYTRNS